MGRLALMTKKEFIVITNKGVDVSKVDKELQRDTGSDNSVDSSKVPDRKCDVKNPRANNNRMTHYWLTDEEAESLKSDGRILDVHEPPKRDWQTLDLEINGNYTRMTGGASNAINWGLIRHINAVTDTSADDSADWNASYKYSIDGTGVDVVIQDDGVEPDHPEFQDANGVSRVKQIDWYAETGLTGTMPANFYTIDNLSEDTPQHGTHVAATVAGKTYGWAKNADIYSMRIFGGAGYEIPSSESFDLIRVWHENKPIDPVTGYKRPTIVNQSWGYSVWYSGTSGQLPNNINDVFYKGIDQNLAGSTNPLQTAYGMTGPKHGLRLTSVDVEQDQLTDAGVICAKSAGNNYTYRTSNVAVDLHSSYYTSADSWYGRPAGTSLYYLRGSSPESDDTIVVGNMDNVFSGTDDKAAESSDRGDRIDIWAAGSDITAATTKVSTYPSVDDYPFDTDYKTARISGTSMATPQVAGYLALLLQMNPSMDAAAIKDFLNNIGSSEVLFDTVGDEDWSSLNTNNSVYGSTKKVLYWPYAPNDGTAPTFAIGGSINITGNFQ